VNYIMKLIIEKQSTDYSVTFSAEGLESDNMTVSEESVKSLRKSTGYLESFLLHRESHRFVTHFVAYGSELYRVFLSPFKDAGNWLSQSQSSTMPSFIGIETTDHAVSSLAWELLYAPEQGFLAESPYFQIIRTLGTDGALGRALLPGPVRLLFMACSPDGTEPLLNYEREEEIILDAVSKLRKKKGLHIDIAETGTLEELKSLIRERDYHVVHISGHGVYDENRNAGYLLMEKESGMERRVSAHELAEALIGCQSLRLFFLSACESGREKEPDTGLARLLISHGVPMVIGMTHSVREYAATAMAETFYRNLTSGNSVAFSLKLARKEFAEKYKATFQWAIPALFTHS
jgi:hypothetical protein